MSSLESCVLLELWRPSGTGVVGTACKSSCCILGMTAHHCAMKPLSGWHKSWNMKPPPVNTAPAGTCSLGRAVSHFGQSWLFKKGIS